MDVHYNFKVKFSNNFQKVNNSEFVEGTVLIAYPGDNRNSSDITEQAFIDALPSLGLVPLVGHWLSDKQNFGGHDITIEFIGNQLVFKDNTVPYGVVKENHNAEWVEIEENGVIHKYLKADVILWYGRYQEQIQKVVDDGIWQSMEINVKSYSEKTNGNIQIDSFEYSALCLLGKDIDEFGNKGQDNVEPCFPSASVTIDKFTVTDQFKEQFNQLIFAVNSSMKGGETNQLTKEKEGENMDKKLELLAKYNLTKENISFNIEELSLEEIESKIKEYFTLLASQKQEEIINALREEKFTDRWGDECRKYSYVDHNETEVFAYDRQDNWNLFGFIYSMNVDKVTIDFATKKRKKFEIVDFIEGETVFSLFPQEAIDYAIKDNIRESEEKFTILNAELEQFKTQFTDYENKIAEFELLKTKVSDYEVKITENESTIAILTEQFNITKEENKNLLEYKNNNELEIKKSQVEDIISDFESILNDNEEFKAIKINAMNYEIEELEKELFAIEGRVKHSKNTKSKKTSANFSSKVSVVDDETEKESYYGNAVKYIKDAK